VSSSIPKKGSDIHMASNTPKKARTDEIVALQKIRDGLTKHTQTITQLVIAGVVMPTSDVIAKVEVRIDQAKAAQSSKAVWQSAVKTDKTSGVASRQFVSALKQTLLAAFTGQVDTLADFGLTPRKRREPLTSIGVTTSRSLPRTAATTGRASTPPLRSNFESAPR
jgi:hypothetical protein